MFLDWCCWRYARQVAEFFEFVKKKQETSQVESPLLMPPHNGGLWMGPEGKHVPGLELPSLDFRKAMSLITRPSAWDCPPRTQFFLFWMLWRSIVRLWNVNRYGRLYVSFVLGNFSLRLFTLLLVLVITILCREEWWCLDNFVWSVLFLENFDGLEFQFSVKISDGLHQFIRL